ncbi:MAG: hypothetical protein FWF60_09365, partial [Oscillospiraceae bacterium]|nr:hypothetical protein [Oscillospiraceae bacterium]
GPPRRAKVQAPFRKSSFMGFRLPKYVHDPSVPQSRTHFKWLTKKVPICVKKLVFSEKMWYNGQKPERAPERMVL